MPNTIDDTGFSRVRFQDLRLEKAQEYRDGFGNQSLKTDDQSGVGQEISISTFAEDDLAGRFETLLSVFDPTAAQGVHLSRLAIVMNKRRQEAVNSTVTLSITADGSGATVAAGFQVSDAPDTVTFQTTEEVIIAPSATEDVEAISLAGGAVEALAGVLTVIKTPVFGVASVTNTLDANIGRLRETDTELRPRMLSSSSASSSTVSGIQTAVANVDGVLSVDVIENATSSVSAEGIPAKSIFPIVDGGSDADVAEALITGGVAAGIGYTEQADIPSATIVSDTFTDPVTGQIQTAHWARPDEIQIFVEVTLNKLSDYPGDGDARVAANIEQWVIDNAEFGEDLFASQLYNPVQDVPGAVVVTLFIGLAPSPVGSTVAVDIFEVARIAAGDVVVI